MKEAQWVPGLVLQIFDNFRFYAQLSRIRRCRDLRALSGKFLFFLTLPKRVSCQQTPHKNQAIRYDNLQLNNAIPGFKFDFSFRVLIMLFADIPADFQYALTEAESNEYVPPGNAHR